MPTEEVKPCKYCQATTDGLNANGYCTKCVVRSDSLSNEAHAALWYAMAVTRPEEYEERFKLMKAGADAQARVEKKHVFSDRDWKEAIRRGLIELGERRLVMFKRGGEGVLEPTFVCTDKLEASDFGWVN